MGESQITWNEGDAPAQPNQSLLGGLELLMALSANPEPQGTRDLARRLGWNAMRVNRLLKTLALAGMARRTEAGKYTTGAGMAVMAAQAMATSGLTRAAAHALAELPEPLRAPGRGVALGVLWRDQVCYLFHTHAGRGAEARAEFGTHRPFEARASSIGRLLMALRGEKVPGGPAIRRQGWAHVVQDEASRQGSVAVPVGSPPAAGLALTGVVTEAEAARVVPLLTEVAGRIAGAMGQ